MEVIVPSFLTGDRNESVSDGNAFGNIRLRLGEVQEVIYPADPRNVSKKFVECRVLVSHVENNTAVSKMYDYVAIANLFGGVGDKLTWIPRAAKSGSALDSNKAATAGKGSKVLLLCISGNQHNAVIIGGIRDSQETQIDTDQGHRLHFVFNGVDFEINDGGEMTLGVHGKTDADGVTQDDVGTSIKISKDGNISVTTKDNQILIDQASGNVEINAKNEVVISSPQVKIGSGDASSPVPLGDKWQTLESSLIDLLVSHQHASAVGPTSPPLTAPAFEALKPQLPTVLSPKTFTE